jgi:hypothetical protein
MAKGDYPMTDVLRCWGLVCVAGLALSVAGCGKSDRPSVHPVGGKVFYKGQPAEGAYVTLTPLDENAVGQPRPGALVKKDGSFRLSTYASYDGAPAGRYAATIIYRSPEKKIDDENAGPDLLRGRYSDPKTTALRIEITEGTNELEPFHLK